MPEALKLCECGCGEPAPIAKKSMPRRGFRKGDPQRFVFGHKLTKPVIKSYRSVRGKRLHVLRAEKALGRPLPVGAVVHHADGSRGDDAPLVICQDQGYHLFLHARMRVKARGGNPDTDAYCGHCKTVKPRDAFSGDRTNRVTGLYRWCRQCNNAIQKARQS